MSTHAERLLVPSPSPSLAEATRPTCSAARKPALFFLGSVPDHGARVARRGLRVRSGRARVVHPTVHDVVQRRDRGVPGVHESKGVRRNLGGPARKELGSALPLSHIPTRASRKFGSQIFFRFSAFSDSIRERTWALAITMSSYRDQPGTRSLCRARHRSWGVPPPEGRAFSRAARWASRAERSSR
jgi:hypothetical protein